MNIWLNRNHSCIDGMGWSASKITARGEIRETHKHPHIKQNRCVALELQEQKQKRIADIQASQQVDAHTKKLAQHSA